MPKPNIFISHRWDYQNDYHSFVDKLNKYGLPHHNYSVPEHNPLDVNRKNQIKAALREQVRQCNFFIIFARMATYSEWCQFEVQAAKDYCKPILAVKPFAYAGGIPTFISGADNQGGPVGFNVPPIIKKICSQLQWQLPVGL